MRMLGPCCALAMAACFRETPGDGGSRGDDDDSTTAPITSTANPTGSTMTSAGTSPSSSSTDDPSSADTGPQPTTSADVTTDPTSPPSDVGGGNCHTLDFDDAELGCGAGMLGFVIGPEQVTFDEPVAGDSPCVEDVDDGDGESAPLTGHYLAMQLVDGAGSTLSFSAPVDHLAFDFGPHHATGSRASLSICTSSTGRCAQTVATADQASAASIEVDLDGGQVVFLVRTAGAPIIGIDRLEVCFE